MSDKSSNPQNTRARFLRLWLIGMSDGLTIPFAVFMAMAGAGQSGNHIIIFTLLTSAFGALLMGLSGYFSGKTEDQHYSSPNANEGLAFSEFQLKELKHTPEFLARLDINEDIRKQASDELISENKKWNEFITTYGLTTDASSKSRNGNRALIIGFSFLLGGFIPVLPIIFFTNLHSIILCSITLMILAQSFFGFIKGKWNGSNPYLGAVRAVLLSSLTGVLAWLAGRAIMMH